MKIAYQTHIFFLQKIFIVLGLTISCVLSESAQDQSNSRFFGGIFGNIFGNGNNNQIGGDGSKTGSCPFPGLGNPGGNPGFHRGGSSHSRGKRSPQPQWWSSNSNYKPNYNNGGGKC